MRRALIVVDVQNDFCPGGSLAVKGGDEVASRISQWIETGQEHYAQVVATMDWHPPPGAEPFAHFSDDPDYVTTWPPHCVAGTAGAELHPNQPLHVELVEPAAGDDRHVFASRRVEEATGLLRQREQVAAIEAHTQPASQSHAHRC